MLELKKPLAKGQKITVFMISEMMAITTCHELEVTGEIAGRPTFKQKGKRKQFFLYVEKEQIIFEGWGLPFAPDSDRLHIYSGNACFNFAGAPAEEVKDYLENKTLNLLAKDTLAKCIHAEVENGKLKQTLIFPELDTLHAVISRMKERNEKASIYEGI